MRKLNTFSIILNSIYSLAAIYFLFIQQNLMNFGLSLFCLLCSFLISFLRHKLIIKFDNLSLCCNLFILFSTLLGTCFSFYSIFNGYDDFLHIWSGALGVAVAYNILLITNKDDIILSKIFIVIYLFMFSMGIASLWEISEFFIDTFLGMHTQAGGLKDTITDMVDCLIGSALMIIYYIKSILPSRLL